MATLAEVIQRQKRGGASAGGALASAIGQKTLEKIDPRQIFNQKGVLTSLFPSLKAFQAQGVSSKKISGTLESGSTAVLKEMVVRLDRVEENTRPLPEIAKTLRTLLSFEAERIREQKSEDAAAFFTRAGELESQYESAFDSKDLSPTKVGESGGKKGPLSFLGGLPILTILKGLGALAGVVATMNALKDDVEAFKTTLNILTGILDGIAAPFIGIINGFRSLDDVLFGYIEGLGQAIEDLKNFDFSLSNIIQGGSGAGADKLDGKVGSIARGERKSIGRTGNETPVTEGTAASAPRLRNRYNNQAAGQSATSGDAAGGGGKMRRFREQGRMRRGPTRIDPRAKKILDLVASKESVIKEDPSGYNVLVGGTTAPLTGMTIQQVLDFQKNEMNDRSKFESTAVGRYQFVYGTLKNLVEQNGVDKNRLFGADTQDELAVMLLNQKIGRTTLDDFLSGRASAEDFQKTLSAEFASIPDPVTGKSSAEGIGSNKALIKSGDVQNFLKNITNPSREIKGDALNRSSIDNSDFSRRAAFSSSQPVVVTDARQTVTNNNGGGGGGDQMPSARDDTFAQEFFNSVSYSA